MDEHLAACSYCRMARKELYHEYVPITSSKSVWLKCCYCARTSADGSSMVYPCGWWKRHVCICSCAYMDMLGYLLEDEALIFAQDKFLMEHVRALQIDYIQGDGHVKFVSLRKVDDDNGGHTETMYSDDDHGALHVSDIIRVTPFRKILPLVEYFLKQPLHKKHALRVDSFILKSLPLLAIKRLSWINTAFRSSVFGASSRTDATLVSYMYRRKQNHQRLRDLTQPTWQWQEFTNPATQGRWCWRMADGEWFNISPVQHIGDGPAGTWQRYRDPTSRCCFWWRNNDDWGWEQLPS